MDEKKILAVVLLVAGLLAVVGWWWLFWPREIKQIITSGTIDTIEVEISSKVAGTVEKMNFSEGDKIEKGDIIAQLDNAELYALYKQARGAEAQALAGFDLAKKSFERTEQLMNDGFVSQQNYDQAKANLSSAVAVLEQARAVKELAQIKLRDSTIKSPSNGYVIVKAVEEGELVGPGSPIVTISDLTKVYIMIYVSEVEVGKIKLGNRVHVYIDSYPSERFVGNVTYISKQAEFTPKTIQTRKERVTQVFAVKVELLNPDLKLKPGLPADAIIKIKQ